MNRKRQRGITLIESAVATTIAAVLAGLAVPSFSGSIERRAVEGAAMQFENDLQFARTEAVARHQALRVSLHAAGPHGSCYVIHTGPAGACACDAQGQAVC